MHKHKRTVYTHTPTNIAQDVIGTDPDFVQAKTTTQIRYLQ